MRILFPVFLLLISSPGMACPFCNTPTARAIRASLLGPDLLFNIGVTVLPFIIFFGITWLIYHGGIPVNKSNHVSRQT